MKDFDKNLILTKSFMVERFFNHYFFSDTVLSAVATVVITVAAATITLPTFFAISTFFAIIKISNN